jgi:hypothetical protein
MGALDARLDALEEAGATGGEEEGVSSDERGTTATGTVAPLDGSDVNDQSIWAEAMNELRAEVAALKKACHVGS